jgi:hypothetical protein
MAVSNFCLRPVERDLFWDADLVGSIQPMQAFFITKLQILAGVGKIGAMNAAITDGLAPLQTN